MKQSIQRFIASETAGGLCLMAAAAVALLLANSPLGTVLADFWHLPLGFLSLHGWVNDGLMSLFFLVVGLELKHEFQHGALKRPQQALVPVAAALGGMIVPCLLFVTLNQGDPASLRGWAIPAATDIAFALGVLALLGPRVPASMKVFLTALAIIDDLGAILIIGLFYTASLDLFALGVAALLIAALYCFNKWNVRPRWVYLMFGAALWGAFYRAGLHPTLAGVILAFLMPGKMGSKLEHQLGPYVAFLVLPVFALANAGLDLSAFSLSSLTEPLALGVMLGLVIGKPLGILAGTWLALHVHRSIKPPAMDMRHLLGLSFLGGIGFTMSLFITDLAYAGPPMTELARLGVLSGSLVAALAGYVVLRKS